MTEAWGLITKETYCPLVCSRSLKSRCLLGRARSGGSMEAPPEFPGAPGSLGLWPRPRCLPPCSRGLSVSLCLVLSHQSLLRPHADLRASAKALCTNKAKSRVPGQDADTRLWRTQVHSLPTLAKGQASDRRRLPRPSRLVCDPGRDAYPCAYLLPERGATRGALRGPRCVRPGHGRQL